MFGEALSAIPSVLELGRLNVYGTSGSRPGIDTRSMSSLPPAENMQVTLSSVDGVNSVHTSDSLVFNIGPPLHPNIMCGATITPVSWTSCPDSSNRDDVTARKNFGGMSKREN